MGLLDSLFGGDGLDPVLPKYGTVFNTGHASGIEPPEAADPSPISLLTGGKSQKGSGVQDYIGQVIDAYLQIHGRQPVYAPVMQQKALEGFTQDPAGAIQRLAKTPGGAKVALPLYMKMLQGQGAQGKAAAQTASAEASAAKANLASLNYIGGLANTIKTSKDPAKTAAKARPIIEAIAAKRGLSILPYDESDPAGWADQVAESTLNVNQSERLEDVDLSRAIAQQNANANTARAGVTERADKWKEVASLRKQALDLNKAANAATKAAADIRRDRRKGNVDVHKETRLTTAQKGYPAEPPRKAGDRYQTPDGRIWTSPNGKLWQ